MEPDALLPYEHSLLTGSALGLYDDGSRSTMLLDVDRWCRPADATDLEVLEYAVGPVLDVGCGPGRITAALNHRGMFTIGIDISAVAVAMAQARGVTALRRNVFGPVPGEGRWKSVVLLDGNIGIGGHPEELLRRVYQLLAPGGLVLAETHPDARADETLTVRFTHTGKPIGETFRWALVGGTALHNLAYQVGFTVVDAWTASRRKFTVLRRGRPAS